MVSVSIMLALAMAFSIAAFLSRAARGGLAEARHFYLALDRLHQLIGDEHQPAADIPLRRQRRRDD